MRDGDTMPEQPVDQIDANGEAVELHATWRAADDVFSSTRDIALLATMDTWFATHLAMDGEETPTALTVFGTVQEEAVEAALGNAAELQVPCLGLLEMFESSND